MIDTNSSMSGLDWVGEIVCHVGLDSVALEISRLCLKQVYTRCIHDLTIPPMSFPV